MSIQNSVFAATPEDLRIHWRLTSACNYSCGGCTVKNNGANCVYMRERLMDMARKLLELPARSHMLRLTGGEPTLHPFLPDIARLFLSRRSRNTVVCLETNGSRELSWYQALLEGLPKGRMAISLGLHPGSANMRHIGILAAYVAENGHRLELRLFDDPALRNESATLRQFAINLAKLLGCPLLLAAHPVSPELRDTQDATVTQKQVDSSDIVELVELNESDSAWPDPRPVAASTPGVRFCCHSVGYVGIDPDGHFHGAPCALISSPLPLWHADAQIDKPRVVECPLRSCANPDFAPPVFVNRDAANDFLTRHAQREKYLFYSLPPLPLSQGRKPCLSDLVKARLRRLHPGATSACAIEAFPNFAWRDFDKIIEIYSSLADESSQENFLRLVRALESGNAAWLHVPVSAARDAHENEAEAAESLESLILVPDHNIREFSGHIREYMPPLRLELPLNPDSLLDSVCWLAGEFPLYKLHLRLEGGRPVLLASLEDDSQNKAEEDAGMNGKPPKNAEQDPPICPDMAPVHDRELTVAIICHDNQYDIGPCIDSVLLANMPGLELFVVDNGSRDATSSVISRHAAIAPDIARIITIPEAMPESEALWLVTNAARGRLIAFVSPLQMVDAGWLERAPKVMRHVDAAIFGQLGGEISEHGVCAFMETWASGGGLGSCVFNTNFLLRNKIRAIDACPDLSLGMRAFHHAGAWIVAPCLPTPRCGHNEIGIADLADSLTFIGNFWSDYKLPGDSPARAECEKALYSLASEKSLEDIRNALQGGKLDDLLTDARLLAIAGSRPVLSGFLAGFAREYCQRQDLKPKARQEDLDWRAAMAKLEVAVEYAPYANADEPEGARPEISVIVPNYNKAPWLGNCLDSILAQSFADFELLLVNQHHESADDRDRQISCRRF